MSFHQPGVSTTKSDGACGRLKLCSFGGWKRTDRYGLFTQPSCSVPWPVGPVRTFHDRVQQCLVPLNAIEPGDGTL